MTPLQKLPKNVGELGKLIVAKGFEKLPQIQKSPNLVTLVTDHRLSLTTNCLCNIIAIGKVNIEKLIVLLVLYKPKITVHLHPASPPLFVRPR